MHAKLSYLRFFCVGPFGLTMSTVSINFRGIPYCSAGGKQRNTSCNDSCYQCFVVTTAFKAGANIEKLPYFIIMF